VQPIDRPVAVTNLGNGSLSSLSSTVQRDDAPSIAWLQGTLDATSAPTTLRVRVLVTNLLQGTYRGRVRVADPAARNVAQVVEVTVQVGEALPVILIDPPAVSFSAASGTQEPASLEVSVQNAGGGTLQGLEANVRPVSGVSDWLTVAFDDPSAPTMMTLTASAQFLQAGTYEADVDVTAASAPGIVGTVRVTFLVSTPG
jgi:hypothetical protein